MLDPVTRFKTFSQRRAASKRRRRPGLLDPDLLAPAHEDEAPERFGVSGFDDRDNDAPRAKARRRKRLFVPPEAPDLDEETRAYDQRLARQLARGGIREGALPLFESALSDAPAAASRQLDDIVGQLDALDPKMAGELTEELARRQQRLGMIPQRKPVPRHNGKEERPSPATGASIVADPEDERRRREALDRLIDNVIRSLDLGPNDAAIQLGRAIGQLIKGADGERAAPRAQALLGRLAKERPEAAKDIGRGLEELLSGAEDRPLLQTVAHSARADGDGETGEAENIELAQVPPVPPRPLPGTPPPGSPVPDLTDPEFGRRLMRQLRGIEDYLFGPDEDDEPEDAPDDRFEGREPRKDDVVPATPQREQERIDADELSFVIGKLDSSIPGFEPPDVPDLVMITPDMSESIPDVRFIERKGNERTRLYNAAIARLVERMANTAGSSMWHIGGSRDAWGEEVPELYLKPKSGKKGERKGGSYLDIAFENVFTKRRLLINTVDVRADGSTMRTRERNAAIRIIHNAKNGDILVVVPKLPEGVELDEESLERFLEPIIQELGRPFDKNAGGSPKTPEELIRRFYHHG